MGIRKHIPNTITSLNLLCGSLGIVAASMGYVQQAFILMLCGATFDFFDGFSARMLGAYSPMGKELDSLADQVSFGLLPGYMLYCVASAGTCTDCVASAGACSNGLCPLCLVPILIAVFSGLRLAKFNIDERQSTSFIGLPTPGSAMVAGGIACYVASRPDEALAAFLGSPVFIAVLSLVLCALLVSEIPMFSMKMHKGDRIGSARIAFAAAAVLSIIAVIALHLHWSLIIAFLFTAYIIINIAEAILKK